MLQRIKRTPGFVPFLSLITLGSITVLVRVLVFDDARLALTGRPNRYTEH
jgi:hypothetical protein